MDRKANFKIFQTGIRIEMKSTVKMLIGDDFYARLDDSRFGSKRERSFRPELNDNRWKVTKTVAVQNHFRSKLILHCRSVWQTQTFHPFQPSNYKTTRKTFYSKFSNLSHQNFYELDSFNVIYIRWWWRWLNITRHSLTRIMFGGILVLIGSFCTSDRTSTNFRKVKQKSQNSILSIA